MYFYAADQFNSPLISFSLDFFRHAFYFPISKIKMKRTTTISDCYDFFSNCKQTNVGEPIIFRSVSVYIYFHQSEIGFCLHTADSDRVGQDRTRTRND